MTLLVVLGVVVIATILAALYLSLKSGRGDEPAPSAASASDRQARAGSRPGSSASLAGRVRSMADRGKTAGSSRRRPGGDDEDEYDVPDYVTARRSSRSAGGDRSSLVTAGTGHRASERTAAGFDQTDPALHAAYGHGAAGYNGYDAAADARVSGPMGAAEPGTGPYATGGYDTGAYDAGSGPSPGYGGETPDRYRVRDPAGERGRAAGSARGRDAGSPRGRYPGLAPEGTGGRMYPPPNPYSPEDPAGTDFGAPAARTPRGHAGPGGRRAGAPDSAPPADYDDPPTALTDSPFPSASSADFLSDDTGKAGDSSPGGRRRIAKIQKPQLRIGRSRRDYDNDPWPSPDEIDGVSDDQFWSDLSSDKPLATTARAAQAPSDSGQPRAPGDGPGRPRPSAGPDSTDMVSAPVPAHTPAIGRGRWARGRAAEPEDGTEPRPRQQAGGAVGPHGLGGPSGTPGPGASGGSRRRGEPMRSPRGTEDDPLTSTSFSQHAREANDSRSYRGSRQPHRPSHGRPDPSADETQTMRPDPRGYGAPGPAGVPGPAGAPGPGSPRRGAPGRGGRPGPGGTTGPGQRGFPGLPPSGPGGLGGPNAPSGPNAVGGPASSGDPRGEVGYRTGARPAGSYPEGTGGYDPSARASRHASPQGVAARPPVTVARPQPMAGPLPPTMADRLLPKAVRQRPAARGLRVPRFPVRPPAARPTRLPVTRILLPPEPTAARRTRGPTGTCPTPVTTAAPPTPAATGTRPTSGATRPRPTPAATGPRPTRGRTGTPPSREGPEGRADTRGSAGQVTATTAARTTPTRTLTAGQTTAATELAAPRHPATGRQARTEHAVTGRRRHRTAPPQAC